MRFVVLILFTLFYTGAWACSCAALGALSQKDIDQTDYIALVRIREILPASQDSSRHSFTKYSFKIIVEELAHYKGNRFSEITVAGGHPKFHIQTSCDFDMNEDEEWVIFGRYEKGGPFVSPCWRTVRYRKADGFRDWQYQRGIKERTFLDSVFQKTPPTSVPRKGTATTYFSSGQVEKVEHYRKGMLHATVSYFFPDGKLYGKTDYVRGQLHGKQLWYYPDGALKTAATFSRGRRVDTTYYYVKTATGYRPRFISVYDAGGNLLRFQQYAADGENWYLWAEDIHEPAAKKVTHVYYHKNGQVSSISYTINRKRWGDYTQYDEQGKIVRYRKYDEQGKVIQ